jgi:hypothetical protein
LEKLPGNSDAHADREKSLCSMSLLARKPLGAALFVILERCDGTFPQGV